MKPWDIIGWVVISVIGGFAAMLAVTFVLRVAGLWWLHRRSAAAAIQPGQEWHQRNSFANEWSPLWVSERRADGRLKISTEGSFWYESEEEFRRRECLLVRDLKQKAGGSAPPANPQT